MNRRQKKTTTKDIDFKDRGNVIGRIELDSDDEQEEEEANNEPVESNTATPIAWGKPAKKANADASSGAAKPIKPKVDFNQLLQQEQKSDDEKPEENKKVTYQKPPPRQQPDYPQRQPRNDSYEDNDGGYDDGGYKRSGGSGYRGYDYSSDRDDGGYDNGYRRGGGGFNRRNNQYYEASNSSYDDPYYDQSSPQPQVKIQLGVKRQAQPAPPQRFAPSAAQQPQPEEFDNEPLPAPLQKRQQPPPGGYNDDGGREGLFQPQRINRNNENNDDYRGGRGGNYRNDRNYDRGGNMGNIQRRVQPKPNIKFGQNAQPQPPEAEDWNPM